MTDPQVAIVMLSVFVLTILLGFPIAFTLMAMGVGFGFYAYYEPGQAIVANRVFDLMVNQTYSVMSNDVLTAVPLFLFMGYVVERANIVDRLFVSLQVAARRVPASMAVAALATCALFATATGIIGAVVTLMGLLAFPAMLKARYDTSFAAGVICAGGCLGILIPTSIMLIVYAATAGISVVKLYAGAMLPGIMLATLYMVYVVGRAVLNPRLAPKPKDTGEDISFGRIALMLATSFFPLAVLILSVLGAILFGLATPSEAAAVGALGSLVLATSYRTAAILGGRTKPPWLTTTAFWETSWAEALGTGGLVASVLYAGYFLLIYVADAAGIVSMKTTLVGVPGLSVAIAIALAVAARYRVLPGGFALAGEATRKLLAAGGFAAAVGTGFGVVYLIVAHALGAAGLLSYYYEITNYGLDTGFYVGLFVGFAYRGLEWRTLRESVFLTVRTSAMVCWLFVGSWTFSSVFAYLGGQGLIEEFVLGLNLSPIAFLIMAQFIIFLLGWPLEWSEIIIIFVPIFLPMLPHFGVDPLFFGILVALNLQTSFLTPPMAMAAYYLKGVAPPHVELLEIFKGVMPFLSIVLLAMVLLYVFPGIAEWLPNYIYNVR